LKEGRANDFPGVEVEETSRGSGLGLHSPVIDRDRQSQVPDLTTGKQDTYLTILDVHYLQDKSHLWPLVIARAGGLHGVLLRSQFWLLAWVGSVTYNDLNAPCRQNYFSSKAAVKLVILLSVAA
jgi:hypothetical protein